MMRLSSGTPRKDYEEILPLVEFSKGIPKKIYQTNHSKNLHTDLKNNIDKIKFLNPNWEYFFYDDKDIETFIKDNYGDIIWSYFLRIDPSYGAAKADLFRYLLIYKFGGVYLDIKSSMTTPLDDVIRNDDTFILSYWDNLPGGKHFGLGSQDLPEFSHIPRGEIMQWFIIASPGHPGMRKVIINVLKQIDTYNPYILGVGWHGVLSTTGPIIYSVVLFEDSHLRPDLYRWVELFDDFKFVYSIFDSKISSKHTAILKSDYRKGIRPVISHQNRLIQRINILYLRCLHYVYNKKQN